MINQICTYVLVKILNSVDDSEDFFVKLQIFLLFESQGSGGKGRWPLPMRSST